MQRVVQVAKERDVRLNIADVIISVEVIHGFAVTWHALVDEFALSSQTEQR